MPRSAASAVTAWCGCGGIERRVGVRGARDYEQLGPPADGVRVELTRDPVEPARSDPGDGGQLLGRQAGCEPLGLGPDRPLGQPLERDELAARANRLRERVGPARGERPPRHTGRLLEVLQQGVGSLGVQQVCVEDEVHATVALERAHVKSAAAARGRRRS